MTDAGIHVDLFAGGGGASIGTEAAMGEPVTIAINHDQVAIAVHTDNHPATEHYTADVWEVEPAEAVRGRRVRHLHASPDCKDFSRAKGGKPKNQKIRSLAWVVVAWATRTLPDVITLENVPEFVEWGPLHAPGTFRVGSAFLTLTACPSCGWSNFDSVKTHSKRCGAQYVGDTRIESRKGETFKRWCRKLEDLGYRIEHRVMHAHHYGAPTSRKRFFLVARRDGWPIVWPAPTHGAGLIPYRTAAECIDWSIPCPSIFERKKPLARKTLARIAAGIKRFVLDNPRPFIVPVNHGGGEDRAESIDRPLTTVTAARRGHALVAPSLIQTSYGERKGQAPRVLDLHKPLGTIVGGGQKHALVAAFLAQHNLGQVGHVLEKPLPTVTAIDSKALATCHLEVMRNNAEGRPVTEPVPTITAGGNHIAEVRAFLVSYFGSAADIGQDVNAPLRTTRDRFGLVTVNGTDYVIADIGMRMLEPHELLRAQFGRFAPAYKLDKATTKKDQVRLIGNSVCPELQEAIVAAQFPEHAARARARVA